MQNLYILKELFEEFCDNVYIATDDGSLGTKGFVTTVLEDQIKAGVKYDEVIAIGATYHDEECG